MAIDILWRREKVVSLSPLTSSILISFQLFGKGFSNKLLLEVIVELKPVNVALGAHNIVQLAELDILDKVDPADLDSVKMLLPSGSAVPPSCVEILKKKFRNLIGIGNMYAQSESGKINWT